MPRHLPAPRRYRNALELARAVQESDELLTRLHREARELFWIAQSVTIFVRRLGGRFDDIKRVHRRVEADIAALRRGER